MAALTLSVGCGDDENTEAGAEAGGTADESESGTAESESGTADIDTGDGDGDGDTGDGDGDGDTGDGDGDGDTGDGDGDGDTGDGDGDTGNLACLELKTQDACDASPDCQSVMGQPLAQNGPNACLEPSEFLGCIPQMGCDDALTWFCFGNNKAVLVNDSCGPDGAEMCDPGVQDPPACP